MGARTFGRYFFCASLVSLFFFYAHPLAVDLPSIGFVFCVDAFVLIALCFLLSFSKNQSLFGMVLTLMLGVWFGIVLNWAVLYQTSWFLQIAASVGIVATMAAVVLCSRSFAEQQEGAQATGKLFPERHDDLKHLKAVIKAIQPKAEIYECNYGDVELDKILNTHLFNFDKVATSARWIEAMEDDDDELENEESGEALEYGIQTFVWKRRKPMILGDFDEFVSTKWPKGVVRAKGMCYFDDEKETCYLFEQSGKQFNITNAGQWYATMPADELKDFLEKNPDVKKDWDPEVGDRMQKIVFIGQNIDRKAIEAELDKCLAES